MRRLTIGNITSLPEEQIEQIRRTPKGERLGSSEDGFQVVRSRTRALSWPRPTLNRDNLSSALGEAVGMGQADADDLDEAMD